MSEREPGGWEARLKGADHHYQRYLRFRLERERYEGGYYAYCANPDWWAGRYREYAETEYQAAKALMEDRNDEGTP